MLHTQSNRLLQFVAGLVGAVSAGCDNELSYTSAYVHHTECGILYVDIDSNSVVQDATCSAVFQQTLSSMMTSLYNTLLITASTVVGIVLTSKVVTNFWTDPVLDLTQRVPFLYMEGHMHTLSCSHTLTRSHTCTNSQEHEHNSLLARAHPFTLMHVHPRTHTRAHEYTHKITWIYIYINFVCKYLQCLKKTSLI